ncbi:MAG: PilN domain-containing protein [Pseudomonadales bacterium]|nr:PilN domain-containing protein [Pseudomonadales bacterium]
MSDIKINLLPWRDELREEKKKEFINVIVGVLAIAGVLIFAVDRFYTGNIDTQVARNKFITTEIELLEARIGQIQLLQQKRGELLSRMKVIQELQGNRPVIVRLFDELARQLSDRVFFLSIDFKGKQLAIKGVAESNNRISSQLRNFSESVWFTKPNVTQIDANPEYGPQASLFSLSVEQNTPTKEEAQ